MIAKDSNPKDDVLVQWISGSRRDILKDFDRLKGVVVGPDEYLVLIKDGRVEETVTQQQIDIDPGLLRRFADLIRGSPKINLAIVSTRRRELQVPFRAYSSDRVEIGGVANLFAGISKDGVELSVRLLGETGQYNREHRGDGIVEFDVDDLARLIGRNAEYVIDTEAVSAYDSSEIQANRTAICTDIISALNSKTPYWANYGLSVNYSSITIGWNEYETLERRRREGQLAQRERDLEYSEAQGESEQRIRLANIRNVEEQSLEFDRFLADVGLSAHRDDRRAEIDRDAKVRDIGYEEDVETRRAEKDNRLRQMELYHTQEVARIIADTEMSDHEKEVRIAEIDLRLKQIQNQIAKLDFDLESYRKDSEARREREQRQFETTLELDRKAREADILLKLSEREDGLREKRLDHSHEESMATIDANVRKAAYANDGDRLRAEAEARAARAELDGFREANEVSHRQNMDSMGMTERMIYAASGRQAPEERRVVCPKCGMSLDARARFCTNCGAKLQGE